MCKLERERKKGKDCSTIRVYCALWTLCLKKKNSAWKKELVLFLAYMYKCWTEHSKDLSSYLLPYLLWVFNGESNFVDKAFNMFHQSTWGQNLHHNSDCHLHLPRCWVLAMYLPRARLKAPTTTMTFRVPAMAPVLNDKRSLNVDQGWSRSISFFHLCLLCLS